MVTDFCSVIKSSELGSCLKVEVAVLGFPYLDVKQH